MHHQHRWVQPIAELLRWPVQAPVKGTSGRLGRATRDRLSRRLCECPAWSCQCGQGRCCTRQDTNAGPGQVGKSWCTGCHPPEEIVHVPLGLGDISPGQRVCNDCPLGATIDRRETWHVARKHVTEDKLIEVLADSAGVDQRVINVPEHQQVAHAATIAAQFGKPVACTRGWAVVLWGTARSAPPGLGAGRRAESRRAESGRSVGAGD